MAATQKGAIRFGLVHIPVALYTPTSDNDLYFNQLCKDAHSRIKYKKVCAHCNKEVGTTDIVTIIPTETKNPRKGKATAKGA